MSNKFVAGYKMGQGFVKRHQFGGKAALDIGCGHAAHTLAFADVYERVVAIDVIDRIDWPALKALSPSAKKIEFIFLDAHKLDSLHGMQFDLVYSLSTFEHLADWRKVLSLIPPLVAPQGLFYLVVSPLYYSPLGHHLRPQIGDWEHLKLPEPELREKFMSAGGQEWRWEIYLKLNKMTAAEFLQEASRYFVQRELTLDLKTIKYVGARSEDVPDPPPKAVTLRRLEVGAGKRPQPGYDHIDIEPYPGIDMVADGRHIPVKDSVYDEIWSHWVFEHFASREIPNLLKEWLRVLKDGGLLRLVTNNQEAHNKCLADGEITWKEWVRLTYGIKENIFLPDGSIPECTVYECHKVGFTSESLREFLEEAGFVDVMIEAGWQCRERDGGIKCPGLVASARKPL